MHSVLGLSLQFTFGALVVIALAWACDHQRRLVRIAGAMSAACVATFCSFVTFALIADNGTDILARLPGVLATLAFALTGCAAGFLAARAIKALQSGAH